MAAERSRPEFCPLHQKESRVNAPTPVVHLYVLLDRSGSMSAMAEQVIAGFNRLLREQQADGQDARMTLVQFDDEDHREVVFDAVPIAEVVPLTARDFVPRGMTPLLDATGSLIGRVARRTVKLAAAGERPEQVLVVTITDGEENHSQEFTRRQVVDLVRAKEKLGWTFAFLGAGLDAYQEAGSLGYDARSVQAFAPDGTGADLAFTSLSTKTADLRGRVRRGETVVAGDFFEGDKPAEDDRRQRGSR
jgi:Mg-chelatase subunit ChlD